MTSCRTWIGKSEVIPHQNASSAFFLSISLIALPPLGQIMPTGSAGDESVKDNEVIKRQRSDPKNWRSLGVGVSTSFVLSFY